MKNIKEARMLLQKLKL